jgi:predicted transposase YdaD
LRANRIDSILDEVQKRGNEAQTGAYLAVLLRANRKAFLEAKNMSGSILPTLEEALTEVGLIPEWIERGREQGLEQGREQGLETAARNALAQGASLDFVQKITGLDIETIKQLAGTNELGSSTEF